MWSVGCIFAELLGRKPLFPGSDHVNQLATILDVLGTPHVERELRHVPEKARRYIAGLPPSVGKPLRSVYPNASNEALDLLGGMLCWDPSQRCTVVQALSHPYLAAFHNPDAEPVATQAFDFDMGAVDAQDALFSEVVRFRPELEQHRLPKIEQKVKRSRLPSHDLAPRPMHPPPAPAASMPSTDRNWPRYGERGRAPSGGGSACGSGRVGVAAANLPSRAVAPGVAPGRPRVGQSA